MAYGEITEWSSDCNLWRLPAEVCATLYTVWLFQCISSYCCFLVVCRELYNFTRCMGCYPNDERYPTDKLILDEINYLTPLQLFTMCSISSQRMTFLLPTLHCLFTDVFRGLLPLPLLEVKKFSTLWCEENMLTFELFWKRTPELYPRPHILFRFLNTPLCLFIYYVFRQMLLDVSSTAVAFLAMILLTSVRCWMSLWRTVCRRL